MDATRIAYPRSLSLRLLLCCVSVLMLGAEPISPLYAPLASVGDYNPPPNFPRTTGDDVIAAFNVAGMHVDLEETDLQSAIDRFGGTLGRRGDAGNTLKWLCYYQLQAGTPWAIWLEGGELDGNKIAGFVWRTVPADATFDSRCQALPLGGMVDLPMAIKLGQKPSELQAVLGAPNASSSRGMIYAHSRDVTIPPHGIAGVALSTVEFQLGGDGVEAISAWKATSY